MSNRKLKSYNSLPNAKRTFAVSSAIFLVAAAVIANWAYPQMGSLWALIELLGRAFGADPVPPSINAVWTTLSLAALIGAMGVAVHEQAAFHDGVWLGEKPSSNASYGSARLLSSPRDLRRAFEPWREGSSPSSPMLPVGGVGLSPKEILCAKINHALVLGGTGSGKTISVLLLMLVQNICAGATMICLDPKLELYATTARFAREQGYTVHLLDFGSPRRSPSTWNPLAAAMDCFSGRNGRRAEDAASEIKLVAEAVIPQRNESSPIWSQAARMLLSGISAYVIENDAIPEEEKNLSTVSHIAAQAQEHLGEVIASLPQGSTARHILEQVANAPAETYGGVRVNLNTFLNDYTDPSISPMLGASTFSVEDIVQGKHIVFVSFNSSSRAYDALVAAFVAQMMSGLRRRADELGGRLEKECCLILEEFGQIPKLPNLSRDLSIVRSKGIHAILACQDTSQISAVYGEECSSILNNINTTLFLASKDLKTLKHYSDLLGCYTVEVTSHSKSKGASSGSVGESTSFHEAKLFRPEDLAKWDWRTGHLVINEGVPYACSSLPINKTFAGDLLELAGQTPEDARARLMPDLPEVNQTPAPVWRIEDAGGDVAEDAVIAELAEVALKAADPRFS